MAETPHLRAVRTDSVSAADAADWLRERIRKGRFVPGQRLVESDITAETGASRSKVREALQRLETEGLITIEEFRGASVKRLSLEEVRQIYRARVALEGIAAGDCALLSSPSEKRRIAELQAEMDTSEAARAFDQFRHLNSEWHGLIVAGARNDRIAGLLARLSVPIYRLLFETFYSEARLKAANSDHKRVTAAILAGDAQAAEAAMRSHIEDGFDALSEIDAEFHS